MDICITGAPGSGKTELAVELGSQLGYNVVDGYADDVREETALALGAWAGIVGNVIVVGERLKKEMAWFKRDQPYIVVGSLAETITYFSLHGTTRINDREEVRRINTVMQTFGILMSDMHVYGVTFFLPLPDDHEDAWLSREIETALSTLGVPYARLSEENRLEEALAIIDQARAALEPTEPIGPGVREGRDDGSEVRGTPEYVPNVSKHGSDGIGQ